MPGLNSTCFLQLRGPEVFDRYQSLAYLPVCACPMHVLYSRRKRCSLTFLPNANLSEHTWMVKMSNRLALHILLSTNTLIFKLLINWSYFNKDISIGGVDT